MNLQAESTPTKPQDEVVRYCESCFEKHGDTDAGVGWPRGDGATRHRVMLDVIRPSPRPVHLLDLGCGASHLLDYIQAQGIAGIAYSGLDLSRRLVDLSRRKHQGITYYHCDVLDPTAEPLPRFDYVIMNGLFTYRGRVPPAAMFDYLRQMVRRAFALATQGVAFNVMSPQVDWERNDLFHLPMDPLLDFLSKEVSRHVVLRHDYGLYEYSAYVYRTPGVAEQSAARMLINEEQPV